MLGCGRLDFAGCWCWPAGPGAAGGMCCRSCPVPGCCWMGWACVPLVCLGWRCVGLLACVRVCVWLPGLPGLRDLLPPGKIPGFSRPGSVGPFRRPGGAGAGWIVGRACCRCRLSCVAAHVGGYACIVREGMPGHYGGALGLLSAVDRLPVSLGKHGNFTEKFPGKTPTEKFFKKFPPMGERSAHEKFLQKGVDNRTQQCYALATTAARNSAEQTQNGGTKP